MADKEEMQEEEYTFPYHYLNEVIPHRYIPYEYTTDYVFYVVNNVNTAGSIADVGCGDGYLINILQEGDGYDISKKAIRFAIAFNPDNAFFVHDIIKSKLPKKYDCIVCRATLEHINPLKLGEVMKNLSDSLNNDGSLIITVPSTNKETEEKHYQHFTKESFMSYAYDIGLELEYHEYLDYQSKMFKLYTFGCWCTFPFKLMGKGKIYDFFLNRARKSFKALSDESNGTEIMFVFKKV